MLIRCVILFALICIVVKTIQERNTTLCQYCEDYSNYDIMEFWGDILKEDCIVPHEMKIAPNVCISGWYNHSTLRAVPGGILRKCEIQEKPNLTWPVEKDAYYTLVMNHIGDASNLSDTTYKDWHHWMVINIPECRVDEGDTISEYKIPVDVLNTGIQRHLFWVFKQPHKLHFNNRQRWYYGTGRMELNVTRFAARFNLTGPVAILHFLSFL